MGLLNNFSDDLLNLIRNAAQNRNPSANSGASDTNDVPSWIPQRQQPLPLSLAGPDLTADITASSSGWPRATLPLPAPPDVSAATDLSWLPVDWSADPRRAQPPAPATQNLTTRARRMKGVPEADIAAATGNPDLMKQLIIQHFGPGSAARTGYTPDGSSASGGLLGDSGQRVDPGTRGFDDARARHGTPAWGCLTSGDPTGLSAGGINLYRADANNTVQLNGPSGLFLVRDPVQARLKGRSGPSRWAWNERKWRDGHTVKDRKTLLGNLAVGDVFHAESPKAPNLICLVVSVTETTIQARTVTSGEYLEFDRQTGVAQWVDEAVSCTIDSVAPLPVDIHNVILGLDRQLRLEQDARRVRFNDAEKQALIYLDAHYSSNRLSLEAPDWGEFFAGPHSTSNPL